MLTIYARLGEGPWGSTPVLMRPQQRTCRERRTRFPTLFFIWSLFIAWRDYQLNRLC